MRHDIPSAVRKALSLTAVVAVAALAHLLVMAGTAVPSGEAAIAGSTMLCHKPGTPAQQTLEVESTAVPGHLGHGDTVGGCGGVPTTTPTTASPPSVPPPTTPPPTTPPLTVPTPTTSPPPTTPTPAPPPGAPVLGTFTVGVTFSDAGPVNVPVTLSCTSGVVIVVDGTASESDPARFTVTGFSGPATSTCTATETVPSGYSSAGSCTATIAIGGCTIANTADVVVAGASTIRTESSQIRRAFVAGETVQVAGTAPDGCRPVLRVDGVVVSRVVVGPDGKFEVDVATDELSAGRHVAEVVCGAGSTGVLVHKVFWIAAPLTSSDVLSVGMLSMLTLGAIGWVGIRTLRDTVFVDGGAGASDEV